MNTDITLLSGQRSYLGEMNKLSKELQTRNTRLATGKDVNTSIDNPNNYFASKGLSSYADNLNARLDGMHNGIQTIQTGIHGINTIVDLLKLNQEKVVTAYNNSNPTERRALGKQFNQVLEYIYDVADDSYYEGINLLKHNQRLKIDFEQSYDESYLEIIGLDISGPGKTGTGEPDPITGEVRSVPGLERPFILASMASSGSVASVASIASVVSVAGWTDVQNKIDVSVQNLLWDEWNTVSVPITITPFKISGQATGGSEENVRIINTGALKGVVEVRYHMYGAKDSITVYYDGTKLYNPGYVTNEHTVSIPYGAGNTTEVKIVINEGGNTFFPTGTAWKYDVTVYPESTSITETKYVNNGRALNHLFAIAEVASNSASASARKDMNDSYDTLLQGLYNSAKDYLNLTHNRDRISYPGGELSFSSRSNYNWENNITNVNNSIAELNAIQAYITNAFAETTSTTYPSVASVASVASQASSATKASVAETIAYGKYALAFVDSSGEPAGIRSYGTNSSDAFGHEVDWGVPGYKSVLSEIAEDIDIFNERLEQEAEHFSQNIDVVNVRDEWINEKISYMEEGSDLLIDADLNEESAELLALKIRMEASTQINRLMSKSNESILKLIVAVHAI